MSKYAKAIATLGVVAGLGVAALPLGAFAAESVHTGVVDVKVTVPQTLTVTIDNEEIAAGATVNPSGVSGTASDPEIDFGNMDAGTGKAATSNTVLGVSTNIPNGFFATVQNTSTGTGGALANAAGSGANYEIAPFATDQAVVATSNTSSTEGWGIRIGKTLNSTAGALSTGTTFAPAENKYHGVPTTATVFDNVSGITEEGTYEYTINYAVNIAEGKAAGDYIGQVTYVVTADPAAATRTNAGL